MIKNFEELKKQLKELAPVINSFNSEAVQVKLIEVLLGIEDTDENSSASDIIKGRTKTKRRNTQTKASFSSKTNNATKTKKPGKVGAATLLTELLNEGYFSKRHTISDIMSYCSSQKAKSLKANEFSPALARFVREKKLNRATNKDGQYEYFKEK
jgi:hypothetical protein